MYTENISYDIDLYALESVWVTILRDYRTQIDGTAYKHIHIQTRTQIQHTFITHALMHCIQYTYIHLTVVISPKAGNYKFFIEVNC